MHARGYSFFNKEMEFNMKLLGCIRTELPVLKLSMNFTQT